MHLECGPCVVRSWQAGDLESLVRHANNRNVWINLTDLFPHPYTTADGENWLRIVAEQQPETHFTIDVGGQAVGGAGYTIGRDIERCSAEIGYWLGEEHWGRGIATAALQTLSDHVFATSELLRLFATPFCANMASRRVLVKAGYQLEGTLRHSAIKDGRVLDRAVYSRVRHSPDADYF